jgi:RecA-family ATPase
LLPLEVVGMIAAQGAGGKTWVNIELALAVGAGVPWLDTFTVEKPGNVLLALGEEPEDEVRWRLYHAAKEMGLTPAQKELAEARVFPLALSGRQVALTVAAEQHDDPAQLPETPVAAAIRKQLEGREWSLILVGPLSRFAGPDVELDNAQATRFVQVLETFTRAAGGPTVLFSHHTGKAARKDSGLGADATAARGSSALSDAARWQANLVPERKLPDDVYPTSQPRLLTLSFPKTTRSRYVGDLRLARGNHGVLRPATNMETVAFDKATAEDKARRAKKAKAANATVQPRDGAGKFESDATSGNGAEATGSERRLLD